MSNRPIEGESAFPSDRFGMSGISERRYYIGKALMGLCANPDLTQNKIESIAQIAIDQADAVMSLLFPHPSEPDEPATMQSAEPPPDHRQLAVGELKRPTDLLQLLDGTFMTIDCYGESGKLVQGGEIRFRKNKFKLGDRVVYTPSASDFATEKDVWYVAGIAASGDYRISRHPAGDGKAVRGEELAPIDHECPF